MAIRNLDLTLFAAEDISIGSAKEQRVVAAEASISSDIVFSL